MGRKAFNLKDFGFGNNEDCALKISVFRLRSHDGWVAEVGVISYLTSHFVLPILGVFSSSEEGLGQRERNMKQPWILI